MTALTLLTERRDADPPWLTKVPDDIPVALVHEDDLPAHDPAQVPTLLVGMHADQALLAERADWLAAFFAAGGTLVMNGLLAYPFHPALQPFRPLARANRAALEVAIAAPDHPLFAGVEARDLTTRKGVAGFYGRGQVPPPDGARMLTTLDGGAVPLDWEWAVPGGGRLLMHPGNDLWMYARDDNSAARLVPNLARWATGRVALEEAAQ